MSDLVERLNRNAESWIPTQAHILEAHNLVALAADRIEQLERVLAQAREAMELHAKMYPHMQKGYTVDAIAAIDEALNAEAKGSRSGPA